MMIANKYDLKYLKDTIIDISPKEREWLSTSKKLDELFKAKLK